jgi:hypothetical protein
MRVFTRKIAIAKRPYFIECFAMFVVHVVKIMSIIPRLRTAARNHQKHRDRVSCTP